MKKSTVHADTHTNSPAQQTLIPAPFFRRVWASLYELALLFGIAFVTALVVQILLTIVQIHLSNGMHSIIFFLVFGGYFTYCWTRGGQTLAQRTWNIKVVRSDNGAGISAPQAWLRYTLSYLSVLPALLIIYAQIHSSEHSPSASTTYTLTIVLMLMNWLALLGTGLMHPQKEALHERLSKTRTVWVK